MTYFVLGLALLGALILLARLFAGMNPATLAQVARWSLITLGVLLALLLLLRGQAMLAAVPAGIAAIAWRAMRIVPLGAWFGLWRAYKARAGTRGGQGSYGAGAGNRAGDSSRIETAWLRMALDHASGTVEGEVLQGPFAGRALSSLDETQLAELLSACRSEDPRALPLLETYLDRRLGPQWREAFAEHEPRGRADSGGPMSQKEALEVLGLGPNPSEREIKDAHRKLMLKLHPDTGGSDYLAAKINQAKDILLSA